MAKKYISPEMKVVMVSNDIIATSNGDTMHNRMTEDQQLAPGRGLWDDDYNGYNY